MRVPADLPARMAMLDQIRERIGPVRAAYADALLAVDRVRHVRERDRDAAWIDEPLPLDTPHGQSVATISAPHVYALGFEALDLSAGDRLLELGSGSGYGAALAAHVVGAHGFVTTVEVDPSFVELSARLDRGLRNVRVLHDDGLRRPDLVAAHDKCWLTFSVSELPDSLVDALPEGGVLVAPVGPGEDQRLVRMRRRRGVVYGDDLGAVRFVRARARIPG